MQPQEHRRDDARAGGVEAEPSTRRRRDAVDESFDTVESYRRPNN